MQHAHEKEIEDLRSKTTLKRLEVEKNFEEVKERLTKEKNKLSKQVNKLSDQTAKDGNELTQVTEEKQRLQ